MLNIWEAREKSQLQLRYRTCRTQLSLKWRSSVQGWPVEISTFSKFYTLSIFFFNPFDFLIKKKQIIHGDTSVNTYSWSKLDTR